MAKGVHGTAELITRNREDMFSPEVNNNNAWRCGCE